tara:strand:- start:489 stop:788 length:300 start_codon:yes stop_codon:yes gene_type:complete
MFKEDAVIKQLFKLNYDKQKQIEHLEQKYKNLKYHNKYLRADVKTAISKYESAIRYIKLYERLIEQITLIFKLDKQLVEEIKESEGIVNNDFKIVIKDL